MKHFLAHRPLLAAAAGLVYLSARASASLVVNGDMERDGDWHGMHDGADAIPIVNEQALDDKHGGKASRHIIIKRAVGRSWPSVISSSFTTETGKTYEVRFWYKVIKGAVGVIARNGADNNQLTPKPKVMFVPRYEMMKKHLVWTEYVGTYTEESGGKGAYLRFVIGSSKEVEFYLDDVSVREIDVSVESALREWRALFPGRDLVCWDKSPWDNLLPVQFPPDAPQECTGLAVNMGQNEYESCSFAMVNLSDGELNVDVSLKDPALSIVLRQAMWVTDIDGAKVNDALPLLEGSLTIPSGESREVWVTIHSRDQAAGDYRTSIQVTSQVSVTIPLDVTVHPVALPDDKPLYTYYWDELVPEWCGADVAMALVEDMRQHYVNVARTHPWPLRMKFDAAGEPNGDYTDMNEVLDAYRLLDPKLIVFWLGAENYLEKQKDFFSDAWKLRFKTWLTGFVKHLEARGWGYDRFAMNPYDERLGPKVCRMVKLIKEIDPEIRIYVNATGQTEDDVRNIAPYVDIWDPYLYDYMNRPGYDRLYEVKKTAADFLRKSVADEFFWTYANPPGSRPKAAPPYRDYRVPVWQAWELGMRGFGYWVYSYKTHWDNHKHSKDGPGWAVVYLANADDAPPGISKKELVVPGKRWEATREGVEDYVYLYMLREAIQAAEERGVQGTALEQARTVLREGPRRVLADAEDHARADAEKEQVIKAIVGLAATP